MDFTATIMGFGLGAVLGSVIADFLHMSVFATAFFFLFGLLGAALASGEFGDFGMDFGSIFS